MQTLTTTERVVTKIDPARGEERCRIEPASMLDDFLAGKPLAHRDGQSYEGDMLQSISRLFVVESEGALNACVERGDPLRLLDELIDRLVTLALPQAMKLANWAKIWRGGILLRA